MHKNYGGPSFPSTHHLSTFRIDKYVTRGCQVGLGGEKHKHEDLHNTNEWSAPKEQALAAWGPEASSSIPVGSEMKPWKLKHIVF